MFDGWRAGFNSAWRPGLGSLSEAWSSVVASQLGAPLVSARYYVTDPISGKVYAFVDWSNPLHWFVQSNPVRQVKPPAPGSNFVEFTGLEFYDSTLAPSFWKTWHAGAGRGATAVVMPSEVSNTYYLYSSRGVPGSGFAGGWTSSYFGVVINGAASAVVATAGTAASGVAVQMRFHHNESTSPKYRIKVSGSSEVTGNSASAPDTSGDPFTTMRIGARNGGSSPIKGRLYALAFNYSEDNIAQQQTAFQAEFGVAA